MAEYLLFFVFNVTMLLSFYLLLSRFRINPLSIKLTAVGLFYFAQLILTLQLVGISGLLITPWVLGVNTAITAGVFLFAGKKHYWVGIVSDDLRAIRSAMTEMLTTWNVFMLFFVGVAVVWLVLSAYFLPPRGVDDLAYHLPRIYEYWQRHRIELLPVNICSWFSFPENADLLFLWPIVFFHNQRWVELLQLIYGLYGIVCLFALLRVRKISRQDSLFLALAFFLCPLMLNQMGANYIDVITTVTVLVGLLFALRFQSSKDFFSLYCAGLATGLMVGMKYTMLIFAGYLQILILPGLFQLRKRHWAWYIALILFCCAYWYLRNISGAGDAFYPLSVLSPRMDFTAGTHGFYQKVGLWGSVLFEKFKLLVLQDEWLATFNAGLGPLFWCFVFPAWIVVLPKTISDLRKGHWVRFYIWFFVLLGFCLLVPRPAEELNNDVRYALIVVPLGMVFFGDFLESFKSKPGVVFLIKYACILFSFLALTTLAGSIHPTYRFDYVLNAMKNGSYTNEFQYLQYANWIKPVLRFAADPIEAITHGEAKGLLCQVVTDEYIVASAVYGTSFQNKVWNLSNKGTSPDSYLFFEISPGSRKHAVLFNKVFNNPNFVLISQFSGLSFFISKQVLEAGEHKAKLLSYYKKTFSEAVGAVEKVIALIPDQAVPVVVTAPDMGAAFRYFSLNGRLKNPVIWGSKDVLSEWNAGHVGGHFYTLNSGNSGYQQRLVVSISYRGNEIKLYENWK